MPDQRALNGTVSYNSAIILLTLGFAYKGRQASREIRFASIAPTA
jgi:hypothetical protein